MMFIVTRIENCDGEIAVDTFNIIYRTQDGATDAVKTSMDECAVELDEDKCEYTRDDNSITWGDVNVTWMITEAELN